MSKKLLIALVVVGMGGGILWKFTLSKAEPSVLEDPAFYHTAQGAHYRINELREVLSSALESDELHIIHDRMYYLEGLLDAFWKKLDSGEKEQVRELLKQLKQVAGQLDGFAGKGYVKATKTSLEKLFGLMDELDITYGSTAGTPSVQE